MTTHDWPTARGDARLLALAAEYDHLVRAADAATTGDECNSLMDQADALALEIIALPAHTIAGVAAKLRAFATTCPASLADSGVYAGDGPELARSALVDAERLASMGLPAAAVARTAD